VRDHFREAASGAYHPSPYATTPTAHKRVRLRRHTSAKHTTELDSPTTRVRNDPANVSTAPNKGSAVAERRPCRRLGSPCREAFVGCLVDGLTGNGSDADAKYQTIPLCNRFADTLPASSLCVSASASGALGACQTIAVGNRTTAVKSCQLALLLVLAWAQYAPRSANAQSFCASCECQIGVGGTIHFWARQAARSSTVGDVERKPLRTRIVSRDRSTDAHDRASRTIECWLSLLGTLTLAPVAAVRKRPGKDSSVRIAGKTKSDELSATRWAYASQLGLRFGCPATAHS